MGNQKRSVEFIANNTREAIELKNKLSEAGLNVNYIYTGSSVPVLRENKYYTIGAGNIRAMYGLCR